MIDFNVAEERIKKVVFAPTPCFTKMSPRPETSYTSHGYEPSGEVLHGAVCRACVKASMKTVDRTQVGIARGALK